MKPSRDRYAAAHRWQAPVPSDWVWKQYGRALVALPPEEWPRQLQQIPAIYRPLLVSRLIREYGYQEAALP